MTFFLEEMYVYSYITHSDITIAVTPSFLTMTSTTSHCKQKGIILSIYPQLPEQFN